MWDRTGPDTSSRESNIHKARSSARWRVDLSSRTLRVRRSPATRSWKGLKTVRDCGKQKAQRRESRDLSRHTKYKGSTGACRSYVAATSTSTSLSVGGLPVQFSSQMLQKSELHKPMSTRRYNVSSWAKTWHVIGVPYGTINFDCNSVDYLLIIRWLRGFSQVQCSESKFCSTSPPKKYNTPGPIHNSAPESLYQSAKYNYCLISIFHQSQLQSCTNSHSQAAH